MKKLHVALGFCMNYVYIFAQQVHTPVLTRICNILFSVCATTPFQVDLSDELKVRNAPLALLFYSVGKRDAVSPDYIIYFALLRSVERMDY
jgi:hypothetical protein